jgi:hypothetical protein
VYALRGAADAFQVSWREEVAKALRTPAGSGLQHACTPVLEQAVEVVGNHEGGT